MILEAETLIEYGYLPMDLPPKSYKPILAACDDCGKVRIISKNRYFLLCYSCANKGKNNPSYGKTPSEETKALMCASHKGKRNSMFDAHHTEESKALMSAAKKGKYTDENNPNFKGGKKVANARRHAKRRGLGHIALNTAFEGCEGHHVMKDFVLYIPTWLHQSVYHNLNTGKNMLKVNALALDFLLEGF